MTSNTKMKMNSELPPSDLAALGGMGLIVSFFLAASWNATLLRELGASELLLRLGPICAAGTVLSGWSTGACGRGADWNLSVAARCVAGIIMAGQLCLIAVATWQVIAASFGADKLSVTCDRLLAALLLAVVSGFCVEGNRSIGLEEASPDV